MPEDNGHPNWVARKLADCSFRMGKSAEAYATYVLGNSLSSEDYDEFTARLGMCPTEKKQGLVREFMERSPYFGENGHIIIIDEKKLVHRGPFTIRRKESSELVELVGEREVLVE